MMSITRLFVVFGALWALQCSAERLATSPVFLWSNSEFFSSKSYINDLVNFRSLGRKVSEHSGASKSAELVVIFVDQLLRSEDLPSAPLSNLQSLVSASKSSITVPHVSGQFDATTLVSALSLTSTASFTLVGTDAASVGIDGAVTTLSLPEFRKAVADGSALSSARDGVTDVFLVAFSDADTASHDVLVADVAALAKDMESVFVFTAGTVQSAQDGQVKQKRSVFAKRQSEFVNGDYSGNTYWPDGIMEGVIISFFLLVLTLIGVCCTLQLQSEFKFDAELKLRKQQ